MGDYTLILDGAAMAAMLQGPDGPVARECIVRATRVQLAARAQLDGTTHGTGKLASDIVKRPATIGGELCQQVGAFNNDYAGFVHDGTNPHWIPKGGVPGPKVLRFVGGKGITFRRVVWHPGTKPNRFLLDNLHFATD